MAKIYIFSGTTEGRLLSEFLCKKGIENSVFVATEYGEIVMKEDPLCNINSGRMDLEQMIELFESDEPDYIIDATHPYAEIVTNNIKEACQVCDISERYYRLERKLNDVESEPDYIDTVYSTDEAITLLSKCTGNILLTTGVKTIAEYVADEAIRDRIYARILPSKESMDLAYDSGLLPRQIIAMEGPFLSELNEALIRQYNIKYLVTKNSGIRGGITEKLSAVKNTGIRAIVIDKKSEDTGYSLNELKRVFCPASNDMSVVSLVGVGVGNEKSFTVATKQRVQNADIIIGAARMIEIGKIYNPLAQYIPEYRADEVVTIIEKNIGANIVVLYSGDTGFYSGATKCFELLGERKIDVKVLPAVSSISYFSSLIGVDYSDAILLSSHGKAIDLQKLSTQRKFFSILSGTADLNSIIDYLFEMKRTGTVYVGYNLGMADEKVWQFDINDNRHYVNEGLYVLGVEFND